jgi:hypothetical protein
MKRWIVMNNCDPNEVFEVEGDNYGEAAFEALDELGWGLVEDKDEEEDDSDV